MPGSAFASDAVALDNWQQDPRSGAIDEASYSGEVFTGGGRSISRS
jgi:hypothetical protein